MHETREAQRAADLAPRGRVAITLLLLVLPLACLALALTSRSGSETAWLVIAGANLVLPAVILPRVWRGARGAEAVAVPGQEPSLS